MDEQLKYFRNSILEATSAFSAWKMIVYSRVEFYVGKEFAEKYVELQKYYQPLFPLLERSLLFHWILLILHCFDGDNRSFSLKKISPNDTGIFLNDTANKKVHEKLKSVRDQLLAHRDEVVDTTDIGTVESLNLFFKNIEDLYNKILGTSEYSPLVTSISANDVKKNIEWLFRNTEIATQVRKTLIGDSFWDKDQKRISNILI